MACELDAVAWEGSGLLLIGDIFSLQFRSANRNHLFGVSLRFLFVGPTPVTFPVSGFLPTERRFQIAFFLHVYFERVVSYRRQLFWTGTPCLEFAEVQCAGSRNEDCRQQGPAIEYVRQSAPPIFVRCFYHTTEKSWHKVTNPPILYGMYTLSTIQSAPGAFFISSRPACCSFYLGRQNELTFAWAIS